MRVHDGRHVMFACRLSEREAKSLEAFLKLAYCDGEDKSVQFRSIIQELDGRLYRDFLHHLKYRAPACEPDLKG